MLFNVNEYKEYLINWFSYPCDNTEVKKMERKALIEARYTIADLQDIVINTEEFIFKCLEYCVTENTVTLRIPLEFKNQYVFTNCTGGWHPDTLIPIDGFDEGKIISKHLLEKFLGTGFMVYFDENIEEYYDDEDQDIIIGNCYCIPEIVITGKMELIREKYEQIKKLKQLELIRVLKKKLPSESIGIYN